MYMWYILNNTWYTFLFKKIIVKGKAIVKKKKGNWYVIFKIRASQVVLVVRNLPANAGDKRNIVSSIPGSGRSPEEGHGNPLQYSCLENPHGQKSLAGYSPWGHKESDTTEATEHARNF